MIPLPTIQDQPRPYLRLRFLLFDLDETLYPPNHGLFNEVCRRINLYMQGMGLPIEEIPRLRLLYYQRHGTTLRGLQIHHQVDADDYLDVVHDLDVRAYIRPNPALDEVLSGLPQEKVIFTNGTASHAQRVLQALGIEHHFQRIFDIRSFRYHSKPDPLAYRITLEALPARASECLLIEDNPRNLQMGKELGMHTLLVGSKANPGNDADWAITEIVEVGKVVRALEERLEND